MFVFLWIDDEFWRRKVNIKFMVISICFMGIIVRLGIIFLNKRKKKYLLDFKVCLDFFF